MLANLAVTLAGKVPVDLNFTIGRAANESCCKRANLQVAISATAFMERVKDFPWPEHVLKLDELMPRLKVRILFWWMMSILFRRVCFCESSRCRNAAVTTKLSFFLPAAVRGNR